MLALASFVALPVLGAPRPDPSEPPVEPRSGPPPRGEPGPDWLDLRRKGAATIVETARARTSAEPWRAVYAATLPADHPLAGLRVTVARAPAPVPKARAKKGGKADPDKAPPTPGPILVRFAGPPTLDGAGVSWADGRWFLRAPGQKKAAPAELADLFTTWPGLGMAPAPFVVAEMTDAYQLELEGEFGGTGIVRMRPRYTAGAGLEPVKLGVSKQHVVVSGAEVTDGQGKARAGILWLEPDPRAGLVPATLRLRPQGGEEGAIDLRRVELARGAKARTSFDARGLAP